MVLIICFYVVFFFFFSGELWPEYVSWDSLVHIKRIKSIIKHPERPTHHSVPYGSHQTSFLSFFLFIALLCQCQSWSVSLWVCFCAVADVTGVVAWWFVGLRAARGRLLTRQSGPNRKPLICTVLWSKINFVQFWKKTNVNISTMYFTEKKVQNTMNYVKSHFVSNSGKYFTPHDKYE